MIDGAKIAQRREAKNWTQKDLGERMGGMPAARVRKLERAFSDPPISTLLALASALGCCVYDLLTDEALDDEALAEYTTASSDPYSGRSLTSAGVAATAVLLRRMAALWDEMGKIAIDEAEIARKAARSCRPGVPVRLTPRPELAVRSRLDRLLASAGPAGR